MKIEITNKQKPVRLDELPNRGKGQTFLLKDDNMPYQGSDEAEGSYRKCMFLSTGFLAFIDYSQLVIPVKFKVVLDTD